VIYRIPHPIPLLIEYEERDRVGSLREKNKVPSRKKIMKILFITLISLTLGQISRPLSESPLIGERISKS